MDLKKKTGLSAADKWEVTHDLHALLLDEVFSATKLGRKDAVLHGGTCLHLVHDSERFSEDLDFLATEAAVDAIADKARRIVGMVRGRIMDTIPGSEIEVSVKDNKLPIPDRMVTWDVRWSHKLRMGKRQVKLEFFVVHPDSLAAYASDHVRLPRAGRVAVKVQIPVGDLPSLWADKVKACATRPEFKWRDLYDLGFVSSRFAKDRPADAVLARALSVSASQYGKTAADIESGLDALLSGGNLADTDAYLDNMANWLDPDTYSSFARTGELERILDAGRAEVVHGAKLATGIAAAARIRPATTKTMVVT